MSQTQAILKHLQRAPITPLEALRKYDCLRLAPRIYELRAAGHSIKRQMIRRNGKQFARYFLAQ